ncbi:MAG: hypothetical protein ACI920_003569, partial [Saprospiraceae bacterium]
LSYGNVKKMIFCQKIEKIRQISFLNKAINN